MNLTQLAKSAQWETTQKLWNYDSFNDIMHYILEQLSTRNYKTTLVTHLPKISKKQNNNSFAIQFNGIYAFRNPETGQIWTTPEEALKMNFYQMLPNARTILSHPFFDMIKSLNKYNYKANKTFKFMKRYGKGKKMETRLLDRVERQKFNAMHENPAYNTTKMHLEMPEGVEMLPVNSGKQETHQAPNPPNQAPISLRRESINLNNALFGR